MQWNEPGAFVLGLCYKASRDPVRRVTFRKNCASSSSDSKEQPLSDLSGIRCVLLDIEGTTSSISFVHDVMFPFALEHLDAYLTSHFQEENVQAACNQIAKDAGSTSLQAWAGSDPIAQKSRIRDEVQRLMAQDVKATGLKALQGLIWAGGFHSGAMKAHVYPDVIPAIERWRENGIDVRIYSSGSVAAQKLFFGHLEEHGNCLYLFTGHYDTNVGGKKVSDSYAEIARDWKADPEQILFVSDVPEELFAAQQAGLRTRLSVRPGNPPLADSLDLASIQSFQEISL